MEITDDILVLWKKKNDAGKVYYSGKFLGADVVAFVGSQEPNDKRPVLTIKKSKPRDDGQKPEQAAPINDKDDPDSLPF